MTQHEFKKAYFKTTQPYLKIAELVLCLLMIILAICYYGYEYVYAYFGYGPPIVAACAIGMIISVALFILYLTCGEKIEHILAFQIYVHFALSFWFLIVSALFLSSVLASYPANTVIGTGRYRRQDGSAQYANAITGLKQLRECRGDLKDPNQKVYQIFCKISAGGVTEVVSTYSASPSGILIGGGVVGLVIAIVYLLDGIDCILKDKAPLRCSCSGE